MKKWHESQRMLKLRVGSIEKWRQLAVRLELGHDRVVSAMLDLHLELSKLRKTWLSPQELALRLAPGATAHMVALGLAENRNGQVVILDVERTVNESLMRRENGLKQLPAVRARDLLGQLADAFANIRATEFVPAENTQQVVELLRARAKDSVILEAWKRALLSRHVPRIETLADLNRFWGTFQP